MSRTTKDLIEELKVDALAIKLEGGQSVGVQLVVGFENNSEFVSHDDPDALTKLNNMVQRGGGPVGMITIIKGKGTLNIKTKPLQEYEDDEHIDGFLTRLAHSVGETIKRSLERR
jgi:hypothetical protein